MRQLKVLGPTVLLLFGLIIQSDLASAHQPPQAPGQGYIHLSQAAVDALIVPGTVPVFRLATYVSGGSIGGTAEANQLDHRWIAHEAPDSHPVIWDLGQQSGVVFVFPHIDHEPLSPIPYEALEFTVWGSNDSNATFPDAWILGTHDRIYRDGWDQSVTSDDWASRWVFNRSFRFVAVYANHSIHFTPGVDNNNQCQGSGEWCSFDYEIDAVGIPGVAIPDLSDWGILMLSTLLGVLLLRAILLRSKKSFA